MEEDRVKNLVQKKKQNKLQCLVLKNKKGKQKEKCHTVKTVLSEKLFKTVSSSPLILLHIRVSWPRRGRKQEHSNPDNLADIVSFYCVLADNCASLKSHRLIRKVNFTNLFSERLSPNGNTV